MLMQASSQKNNNLICDWPSRYSWRRICRCVPEKSLDKKYSTYGIYTCCTKIYNSFDRQYAISYKETLHTISRDSLRVRAHLLSPWAFIISECLDCENDNSDNRDERHFRVMAGNRIGVRYLTEREEDDDDYSTNARFTVVNLMPPSIHPRGKKTRAGAFQFSKWGKKGLFFLALFIFSRLPTRAKFPWHYLFRDVNCIRN